MSCLGSTRLPRRTIVYLFDDLDVPIDADPAGLSFCISSSHTSHAEFVYYYLLRIDFAAPPQVQFMSMREGKHNSVIR